LGGDLLADESLLRRRALAAVLGPPPGGDLVLGANQRAFAQRQLPRRDRPAGIPPWASPHAWRSSLPAPCLSSRARPKRRRGGRESRGPPEAGHQYVHCERPDPRSGTPPGPAT
jgi:hypothetical protein